LTDYQNLALENASRLKAVPLSNGHIMVLWEKWTDSQYVNSYAMTITEMGNIITPPVELGEMVRLNRTDDPLVVNDVVYLAAGDKNEQKLELIAIGSETSSQQPINYSLNLSINGFGRVVSDPAGIDCRTTCSASYPDNSTVTLTAIAESLPVSPPVADDEFSGWSGSCSGTSESITVQMTEAKNCTATFTPQEATISHALNISALGDSLTLGVNNCVTYGSQVSPYCDNNETVPYSYRHPLWNKMQDAGWQVDFVGHTTTDHAQSFDQDVDAKAGSTINDLLGCVDI
jgi:hypothetical protein